MLKILSVHHIFVAAAWIKHQISFPIFPVNCAILIGSQVEVSRCKMGAIAEATEIVHFVLFIDLGSVSPKTALHLD
jgi:hypothetical protein